MRRYRMIWAALAVVSASAAWAGPNSECPILPDPVTLSLDQVLTLGDHALVVHAQKDRVGSSREISGLGLVLQAGSSDPRTGGVKPGTFVPELTVRYRLSDERGLIASGALPLGLTDTGPAYHNRAPIRDGMRDDQSQSMSLELELEGPQVGTGEVGTKHGGEECPVPQIPANVHVMFDIQDALADLHLDPPFTPGNDLGAIRMTLLSQRDPVEPENYSNIWGWNNGTTYLAIIGNVPGTTFFDVTDPANPVQVGFIDGPDSSWREIKTYKNFAYIVTEGSGTGQGLQIVDLTNPLSPTLVNTYAVNFTTAHTLFIDEAIGRAYINGTNNNGSSSGMRILTLEPNPASPVEVGAWTPRYVHDMYAANGRAFLSEIYDGLQEVYDANDPANLVQLGSWTTPNAFTHNCWANPTQSLLVTTDETTNPAGFLAVYDISNLANGAALVGRYFGEPGATVHNAYFTASDPQRVAMSYYGSGGHLIDVRRPTYPVRLGAYDSYPGGTTGFVGAWGMYPYDPRGYLYISDIQTGLYIVRYDPTGGVVSGVLRDATTNSPLSGVRVMDLASGEVAISGTDGVYGLYVPQGAVNLRLTAPGYISSVISAPTMPFDGRVDQDATMQSLPRGALTGRVRRSDTLAGIAGAVVQVPALGLSTVSTADGSYDFGTAPIGGHVITADAFGYAANEKRVVLGTNGGGGDINLEPARFVDDAETNKGWALGNQLGDSATSGKWERVNPNGTGGGLVQPEDDHTAAPGVVAFITGQSAVGAQPETGDVDGGPTSLVTPAINTADLGAAQIDYWRWMTNNGGFFNGGSLVIGVSSDNGANWTVAETTTVSASQWQRARFNLSSFVALTAQTKVRFQARPNTPYAQSVLEAGLDDFQVVRACRARFNTALTDLDGDGAVDPCDSCSRDGLDDADGDGICGDLDNAPRNSNASQLDSDGDGVGDAGDNCLSVSNAAQRDLDRDGLGDPCDSDLDGDAIANSADSDDDNDGVLDGSDNCLEVANALQSDRDSNNIGDACDGNDGEVFGVRLTGTRIDWEKESNSIGYNLYRGDLGAAPLLPLAACKIADLRTAYAVDLDLPGPADGFFYLVARRGSTGIEGSLGRKSNGAERAINTHCP